MPYVQSCDLKFVISVTDDVTHITDDVTQEVYILYVYPNHQLECGEVVCKDDCSPLDRVSCFLSEIVSESFCTAVPVEAATRRATYAAFSAELYPLG